MSEVGSAFVSLVPSARGFGHKMDSQLSGDIAKSGKRQGATWGKIFAIGAGLALGAKAVSFLGDSLAEARESVKVGARTTNVIETMGLASKVTAGQVGDLANKISLKTGIDDEAIQSTENLLLGFSNLGVSAGKVGGHFAQATGLATDMSAAMEKSAKSGAVQLGRALQDPVKGLTALTRAGVSFTTQQSDQVKKLVENGHLFKAQGIIIGEVKKKFGGAAAAMASPAEKAKVAFDNLKEQIGKALLPQVDRFLTFLTDTVIPGISTFAGKVKAKFNEAKEPVKRFFESVKNSETFKSIVSGIADAAVRMKRGFKGAKDALDGIDFSNLDSKQVGTFLGTALAEGLNKLVTLAPKVTKKIGEMFGKVDWVTLGIELGKQVPALLVGLALGILNFDPLPILKGLADHWQLVLVAVLTLAFAPAKMLGPLTKILTKIPFVGAFLARSVVWLNELGGKLLKFGGEVMKFFFRGLGGGKLPGSTIVKLVMGAFKAVPAAIKGFFDTLRIRLGVYALEGAEATGKGFRTGFIAVLRFIASIPGRILSTLGNLAKLLFPKGTAVVEGMFNGLKTKVVEIFGWVKALPGRVVTAVGNVSDLLYEKGAALIGGFARGMLAKLNEAYDAAKKIVSKIAGLFPGSPVKEGPLRAFNNGGVGKELMHQLAEGFRKGGKEAETGFENFTDLLVKKIKKKLEKAKDAFNAVRDASRDLRDSVASAFTTDLFSGSIWDLINNGFASVANLVKVKDAIAALREQGVNPAFLAALAQSGNSELVLQLAADPSALGIAQDLFAQQQALSNEIGASVAEAKFGEALDRLGGRVEHLEQQLLDVLPRRIGREVGRALDGMGSGAQRAAA